MIDHNHFSFSHPNPTHLSKHEFSRPNNQFYQRIWHVEYYSVHGYMVWYQKFLTCEISDFTPYAHAQNNILHIKYAEKTHY